MDVVYRYGAIAGGGPVMIEVSLLPPGTTSVFKLHHVVPHGPDEVVLNKFHEVFVLSSNGPPAGAVLHLKPITMAPSADLLMRAVQGGTIAPAPGGGNQISGGTILSGTTLDLSTGASTPIVQAPTGETRIGPLTPGHQADLTVVVQ